MNWGEISSTFHYWYYLDLVLDRRFILVSYFHFRIISFFDQISTSFRRNFDRCPFDELSFDENSTNGRVRRDVIFDGKSHSTKGLSTKCHGRGRSISLNLLNLPGTPNTSSEYYMECAACANDGFEKKK